VIRGLRNVFDFYEEKDNQYWHEDLGLLVPIFYVISHRDLSHISSKAVRIVDKFKGG
jgi:phosphopantetheine adenylyltransferase